MLDDDVVEKITDLTCRMLADFQSRTPDNPVTRDDIRGYIGEAYCIEEDCEEVEEDARPSSYITISGASASTW